MVVCIHYLQSPENLAAGEEDKGSHDSDAWEAQATQGLSAGGNGGSAQGAGSGKTAWYPVCGEHYLVLQKR